MSARSTRRPPRVVARAMALGIGSLLGAAVLASAPSVASGWSQSSAEATLWQLMNGARVNNGVAPVQSSATLTSIARWRSADMLERDYFSHTIPGCNCLVYTYYDSNGLNYAWAGENIGWNSGFTDDYSPVRVHEKFMESPGHRANVLDARFTHGGVGAASADGAEFLGHVQNTRMYTELFMQAKGSSPTPPPSGGSGSGGGGGGGGGGNGGGGTTTKPSATPEPVARQVEVDAPRAPTSSQIDGTFVVVSAPVRDLLTAAWMADETAADRAADAFPAMAAAGTVTASAPDEVADGADMEVLAARSGSGGLDGLIGAVLALLFG